MPDDNFLDDIINNDTESSILEAENAKLYPLLDYVERIESQGINLFTRSALLNAPESFWNAPSPPDHPEDEQDEGGNLLHVRRVANIVSNLVDLQIGEPVDTDALLSAALIFKVTQYHDQPDGTYTYDGMYPYTIDSYIVNLRKHDRQKASNGESVSYLIPDELLFQITRLVHCHLGRYSPIPETMPVSAGEWILHTAHMMARNLDYFVEDRNFAEWRDYD